MNHTDSAKQFPPETMNPVLLQLYEEIKHGDEEHQNWLLKKIVEFEELFLQGEPIKEKAERARQLILQLFPPAEFGESSDVEELFNITGELELLFAEFAQSEAQQFAEWCGQNNWIHWHDEKWRKIILINEFRHEHQHATTAELHNSEEFKRYKEGKG